ncbi:hypothetical protein [Janthinobacterium psychrotolerans]|uniref:Uncharacterized protein n=1 Tax=Janthinobacterium psychrotolerans TaxID=1747903 RepID=A0A1A7C0X5_9BURK|nr:hypothetical protein [Janthinobacterium psychrotolerans]OBV38385.1 hypothetical protein ASR47_1005343 [Janthinobacterium psychrotolerans]
MHKHYRMAVAAALCCLAFGPAMASALPGDGWQAVDDATLEQARGGFEIAGGLNLSLGIERMVSINGEVMASTSFTIADVARLGVDEARQARAALTAMSVVQNGAGNLFAPGALDQAMAGTVIQNSLNDQVLRSQTVINTSVNSLELLKIANFQETLQTALGTVAGPR